jgi:two-component system cell cycle sensor histidine kinase PleC
MMRRLAMDARRRTRKGTAPARDGFDPVGRLAHALRTPLNAILGFSELTALATFGPHANPRYAEYADLIHRSAQDMLGMIDALARLLRLRDGTWPIERRALDLSAVARDALRAAAPHAAARGQTLIFEGPERTARRRIDAGLVSEAVGALLANACDFSSDGAEIVLCVTVTRAGGVRLEVLDRGVGIPAGELRRVLAPFVQLKPAGVPTRDGHGLGLALADAIAQRSGAQLRLAARQGGGVRACLSWPAPAARLRTRRAAATPAL